jgi:hypothetical protein
MPLFMAVGVAYTDACDELHAHSLEWSTKGLACTVLLYES